MTERARIPERGRPAEELLAALGELKRADADWRGGKVFSLVYHAGEAHERLLERAHAMYASANLLNPMAFRSLRRMEAEVTQMVASLLNGPPSTGGCVTSGGTESILCAVATYREQALVLGAGVIDQREHAAAAPVGVGALHRAQLAEQGLGGAAALGDAGAFAHFVSSAAMKATTRSPIIGSPLTIFMPWASPGSAMTSTGTGGVASFQIPDSAPAASAATFSWLCTISTGTFTARAASGVLTPR